MFLELKNVEKSYGENKVLEDINFSLEKGKILCLLGPSGCGKTTILNSIGGFINLNSGSIILDGVDITNLSPESRNISTVFQSYGLFTHKNVLENVKYGLKFRKLPKSEMEKKAMGILEVVGLKGFEKRRVTELSGGQQQRVALARSLAVNPKLILLDEPFSNLDENLKEVMRKEIKRLVNMFNMTTILVTHDQEDAFTIADEVILLNKGKIVQHTSPIELYNNPNSKFSLEFIGNSNVFDNGYFNRYEDIKIVSESQTKGEIIDIVFKGAFIEYTVKVEDRVLKTIELNGNVERKIGEIVFLEIKDKKIKAN